MTLTRRSTLPEAAAAVARALDSANIPAVLTGGACATIYTGGAYQSHDLDFIVSGKASRRSLDDAMATEGFGRDGDRYVHPATAFFVEFPRGPLAIGEDLAIRPILLKVGSTTISMLSPTDACRDRLAAFYFWADRQSLRVAVEIARRQRLSLFKIRRWSKQEGFEAKYAEFAAAIDRRV